MAAGSEIKEKRMLARDAAESRDETYAIFTGSGVRVDLASFFRSDSGKRALKEVSDSAKRVSIHRTKGGRLAR